MATAVGRIPRHAGAGASTRFSWPWTRRLHQSAALRSQLHLAAGERALVRAGRGHNVTVVATERALYWYPSIAGWTRLGWDEIGRVYQHPVTGDLVVTCPSAHRAQDAVLPACSNRRLLALAQERIAATRLVRTQVTVDGHPVRVEGRRRLGTGQLCWFAELGPDVDPEDPALSGKLDRALAELRASLGV